MAAAAALFSKEINNFLHFFLRQAEGTDIRWPVIEKEFNTFVGCPGKKFIVNLLPEVQGVLKCIESLIGVTIFGIGVLSND